MVAQPDPDPKLFTPLDRVSTEATLNGSRETTVLLTTILSELQAIRSHLPHPPQHHPPSIPPHPDTKEHQSSSSSSPDNFPSSLRTGPLLRLALQRYRLDAIPQWSSLYGAHFSSPPRQEKQRSAWQSLVGEAWQVPHDGRVSLCFLRCPVMYPSMQQRVRNFLYYLHSMDGNEQTRGSLFNVWDWFDGGGSSYWYPGKGMVELEGERKVRGRVEEGLEGKGERAEVRKMVAPWRRMINFQGLMTVRNCETEEKRGRVTEEDLCPFLLPSEEEAIFELPVNDIIWRAVRSHLRSKRATEGNHSELLAKGCLLFHLTFYEILGMEDGEGLTELWPCGEMYSNGEKPTRRRRIRESALTLIAVPGSELPGPNSMRSIFWTMICLRPMHFQHPFYFEKRDDLSQGNFHEMIDDMADIAHKCLMSVLDRWEEVAEFFEELLCGKKALFDPNYHDTLLTDDVTLSRSKKYFWAIEFLKELEKSVTDNICQVERFTAVLRANPPPDGRNPRDFSARIQKQYAALAKLEALRVRFAHKREEAVALRDGLFNASAVIESRMSTKLGENIKLLTFVSIFFLPLSFCTSLWSVSDDVFPLSAFVVTMPVMAIVTYIVSLNLDAIPMFWRKARRKARSHTADHKQHGVGDSGPGIVRSGGRRHALPAWLRSSFLPKRGKHEVEELPLAGRLGDIHVHVSRVQTVEAISMDEAGR